MIDCPLKFKFAGDVIVEQISFRTSGLTLIP